MNKLKYVFSHGALITLILAVVLIFVTCTAYNWISQINSAKDGIEMLIVDSTLTVGSTSQIEKAVKEKTNAEYVGVATLESSDAQNYVNTIENYTLKDYIYFLLTSKDAEILIVPENMLEDMFSLKNISAIDCEPANEKCCIDGKCYAVPLKNKKITSYGGIMLSAQYDVYGILLNGDHTEQAQNFLLSLESAE